MKADQAPECLGARLIAGMREERSNCRRDSRGDARVPSVVRVITRWLLADVTQGAVLSVLVSEKGQDLRLGLVKPATVGGMLEPLNGECLVLLWRGHVSPR